MLSKCFISDIEGSFPFDNRSRLASPSLDDSAVTDLPQPSHIRCHLASNAVLVISLVIIKALRLLALASSAMTLAWLLPADPGSKPAKILPDITPGICTRPQTLKLLMVGVRADVSDDVRVGVMASVTLAPRAKSMSILDLDSVRAVMRLDVSRASAVTEFPRTRPQSGMIRLASNDLATDDVAVAEEENIVGKLAMSKELPHPTNKLNNACRFNLGYVCLHLDEASRAAMTASAAR